MTDVNAVAKQIINVMSLTAAERDRIFIRLLGEYPEQISDMLSQLKVADVLKGDTQFTWDFSALVNGTIGNRACSLTNAEYDEVYRHSIQGRKVDAIKSVRSFTGLGLKEAKDAVEGLHMFKKISPF